ncbi:MAG: LacI family transcriptional regulator, partial [Proteobacteria bacterium]
SLKAAAESAGFQLLIDDANQQQALQIEALDRFILQKVDLLVFSPIVESGWHDVLLRANRANIPVIVFDRSIEKKDFELVSAVISADFLKEGERATKCLFDSLPIAANRRHRIIELRGTIGSSAANLRHEGFLKVLKSRSDIDVVSSVDGDFKESLGKELIVEFLRPQKSSSLKIDGVFAHNDSMALGAITAFEQNGYKPGRDVKVSSVDGIADALKAILAGKLLCSAECSPMLGPIVMETARKILQGEPYAKSIIANETLFDSSNAAKFLKTNRY